MSIASINGQLINYELSGPRDFRLRTPVLMLHGNGESMKIFRKTAQLLSQSKGCVLMDSRWQGGSKPEDPEAKPKITYELMADDSIKLMEDELGIGEYDIVGFSDGAIIALYMALRSIRVRRLILIGVNSDPEGLKPKMIRLIRRDLADAIRKNNAVETELLKLMLEEPHLKNSDLASVICETTVVYGQRDEAIRREHAEAIADAIPRGSFLEVRNAGHDIPSEYPEGLADLIKSLL